MKQRFTQLKKSLSFISLAFFPKQGRVTALYNALSHNNSLCEDKLYLNLGYWKDSPEGMDLAGDYLCDLLAKTADIKSSDVILDVGYGFGDQDIFLSKKYNPKMIYGINITPHQVRIAQKRVEEAGVSKKLRLEEGNATSLRYEDNTFDLVFALEAAFHFQTREKFFKEAYRVLKPGGKIVLTDITAFAKKLRLKNKILQRFGQSFWQIPDENLYTNDIYDEKMKAIGFKDVTLKSIWHEVYPPYVQFAKREIANKSKFPKMNWVFRKLLAMSFNYRRKISHDLMDYVLVYGVKPHNHSDD